MTSATPAAPGETPAAHEDEPGEVSQRRRLIIIGALLLGMLLAALDQTIVATALPTIAGTCTGCPTSPGW